MPNFAIPTLFVVKTGNTLPTTGSTDALTASQFGIYRPDYTPATAGNAGAAKYLQLFQGNNIAVPMKANKRSDAIYASNIVEWYKVPARTTATNQITEVSALVLQCEEEVTVTVRLDSNYINDMYYNGLTKSFMVQTPCCECGEDPCAALSDADYDAVYAEFATKINADRQVNPFIVVSVTGTHAGGDIKLILTGKALVDPITNTSSDPYNNPFRQDRLSFRTFIHKGPAVSQDFETEDRCDVPGTVTVTQRATYTLGSAASVKQLEKNLYSYSAAYFKDLFMDADYNGEFASEVDAAFYDMYYIKYKMPQNLAWISGTPMDETSIIAIPTGAAADIEAILTALFGAPENKASTADVTFSPLAP